MGIPKKGSRIIEVDNSNYRYIVAGNDDFIDLVIESADSSGQRLTLSFEYHHEKKIETTEDGEVRIGLNQRNQITPVVVKRGIEYGIQNGWTPNIKGKEIRLGYVDDKIELNLKTKT